MNIFRLLPLILLAALPLAADEWYENYESGKNNCDAGNYGTCLTKMNAAIGAKPKSEKGSRTYGMNFVDYTPYYYLGLALFNQGNVEKASKYFQTEADFGIIYKTANSGFFSLMSKQANQAVMAGAAPQKTPVVKPQIPAVQNAGAVPVTSVHSDDVVPDTILRMSQDLTRLSDQVAFLQLEVNRLRSAQLPAQFSAAGSHSYEPLIFLAASVLTGFMIMLQIKILKKTTLTR